MRTLLVAAIATATLLVGCNNKPPTADLPDACRQVPDSGMCRASKLRYYHDVASQHCRPFIWGGCQGSVPFQTMEACVSQCNARAARREEGLPMTSPPGKENH